MKPFIGPFRAGRLGPGLGCLLLLLIAAPIANATSQQESDDAIEPWLAPGTQVVLKASDIPLRDGEWLSLSRDHLTFSIEKVSGERLLLASHDKSHCGWMLREYVVPLDGAIDYFSREIDRIPHHADAYWMRGRVWAYRSEDERAIADFNRAIELRPDQAPYYARRALILMRSRHLDKALADCDKAIQLDPKAAGPYLLRASILLSKGEPERARADLDRAIGLDPLKPLDKANTPVARDANVLEPGTAGARLLLAMKIEDERRDGVDPDEPDKAPEPEPRTVPELLDRGLTLYDQKDYNGAIAAFTEAIRLDPNSARAYGYRAQAWGAKHYRDREIADLDQAIRLEPRNVSYRLSRAQSWSSQGRHDQAMVDYDDAIQLEPNNAQLYVSRGNEWRRHVKLDLAIADYDRAIQIDPTYIHAYICRALISKQRRAFAQAVAELSEIVRAAPDNDEAHRALARILATCNDSAVRDGRRAVQEATRACELTHWNDPNALDTLAAAYAETGDYQSAVQWQTKAIALTGINPTASVRRAMRSGGGRRGVVITDRVGFEDRLAFYKRKRPCRE
ncbi:MAG: tetratricopeptide repeat protein [Isosphaeraceae bacterium]